MKYLVDSNIIIYHLNQESIATNFLRKHYHEIAISQITFIEVLSFEFSQEVEKDVRELLATFKILDITQGIANQAIENRRHKKIKIPDNIIVATAMVHDLVLVTRNEKDFKIFDMEMLNPFSLN
ncbi:MAG: nucleotide-binding protein [Sulfurovum sp. FS08-3]|nr:MAG: nucleotide-binding protein [Sulfurovum sp. FS08-3]